MSSGNHDISLDPEFYAEHGMYFHNQQPQDTGACIKLVRQYKSIVFLSHGAADIKLIKENGPQTYFKAFGSPFSPRHGLWAFGYPPERASSLWDQIPLETDVLITHTPPKFHCDESSHGGSGGCETLRQALWRVRPSLLVCGHIHEGRGGERVSWDLGNQNVKYKEHMTGYWEDLNGRNKGQLSLLDLSTESPEPLRNTGAWDFSSDTVRDSELAKLSGARSLLPWTSKDHPNAKLKPKPALYDGYPPVRGQGGELPSGRGDVEALEGRMGRKETCVVNAAIMATSWPYKINGGRKFNKPIIVDIDLPYGNDADGTAVEA